MAALSTNEAIRRWKAARKMAHTILNAESGRLPDSTEINQLTCTIFGADLARGESATEINRAGQDADQENMLASLYEGRNRGQGGNF